MKDEIIDEWNNWIILLTRKNVWLLFWGGGIFILEFDNNWLWDVIRCEKGFFCEIVLINVIW